MQCPVCQEKFDWPFEDARADVDIQLEGPGPGTSPTTDSGVSGEGGGDTIEGQAGEVITFVSFRRALEKIYDGDWAALPKDHEQMAAEIGDKLEGLRVGVEIIWSKGEDESNIANDFYTL